MDKIWELIKEPVALKFHEVSANKAHASSSSKIERGIATLERLDVGRISGGLAKEPSKHLYFRGARLPSPAWASESSNEFPEVSTKRKAVFPNSPAAGIRVSSGQVRLGAWRPIKHTLHSSYKALLKRLLPSSSSFSSSSRIPPCRHA